MRSCIFCQVQITASNDSNEHALPLWLQRELNLGSTMVHKVHKRPLREPRSYGDEVPTSTVAEHKYPVRNLVAGGVCRRCNNEWMSELETAVKPVLLNYIRGRFDNLLRLGSPHATLVARWAAKTAFVLDAISTRRSIVPRSHAHEVFRSYAGLPRSLTVLAGKHAYPTHKYSWVQGSNWWLHGLEGPALQEAARYAHDHSYKITLQLSHLVLLVAYWDFSDWLIAIRQHFHIPIVLPEARLYYISPPRPLPKTSKEFVHSFADQVRIALDPFRHGEQRHVLSEEELGVH